MRLRLCTLGQRMPAWVDQAFADYTRRLPRGYQVELTELKPAPRNAGRTIAQMLDDEAARIEAACAGSWMIACDERGEPWTTRELAANLGRWHDDDASVAFVVGSADGLAPRIKAAARTRLALSPLTLPHALVRVLLVEQIYRAASLIAGHPYHRD